MVFDNYTLSLPKIGGQQYPPNL